MAVNSAKSWWNIDFCHYRNDVCPVMSIFQRWSSLLAFISTSLCILLINSKCSCSCLVCKKWLDLNLTCLTARFGNVMFTAYQPSDFLRGVCLCCREMRMIYMHHWKQQAWVSISAMWLQVVMSVSRCMLQHNVWPLVVWFNILVTSMLPTWYIRWPTKSWIW